MSTKIKKIDKDSLARMAGDLKESGFKKLKVGDIVVDRDGRYRKISAITEESRMVWADRDDPKGRKKKKIKETILHYQERNEEGIWEDHGKESTSEFTRYSFYCILPLSIEQLESDVIGSIGKEEKMPEEKISESTELTTGLDKDQIQGMKDELEVKLNMIEVKSRILERIMNRKKNELRRMVDSFELQIKRVQRVIDSIELYLGVNEDIVQIQEGENAPLEMPIALRQQILYMDEEVGDPTDQGLDFEDIDKFDDWLVKDENFKKLIPEEKGVVVVRVRRRDKYYADDPFYNSIMNLNNENTYFLIRNGDNLYRVWGAVTVGKRLFPLRKEFQELLQKFEEAWSEYDKEEIEQEVYYYRRNVLVMQGLIERTQIFQPIPPTFNLLNPDTYGEIVQFIYDDEIALPTGRKSFKEWKKEVNEGIERGSRVFHSGVYTSYGYVKSEDFEDRFLKYYRSNYTMPSLAPSSLYTVETCEKSRYDYEKKEQVTTQYLCIKYNNGDDVHSDWGYETNERKNRVTFIIEPEDEFIFNYDNLDLDDVEFYINSRVDRPNYLDMMPVLFGIRRRRLEELEWEKDFVSLTANEVAKELKIALSGEKMDKITENVWDAIDWWKNKVIWKRPITKDDSKALRMIKGRVKRKYKIK